MTRGQRRVHIAVWLVLGPTLLVAVVLLAIGGAP